MLDLIEQLFHGRRSKRHAMTQRLVQHDTQRIQVRLRAGPVRLATSLFRAQIGQRSQHAAAMLGIKLLVPRGQAEVDNPGSASGVDQHVARLDVAVHDAARVGVVQAFGDLRDPLRGLRSDR